MCSKPPKEFEKVTEVLPFTKYGLTSKEEFKKAEDDLLNLERLKKAGLSAEEIKLYTQNESGVLAQRKTVDHDILKNKLEVIYDKIAKLDQDTVSNHDKPSTSKCESLIERLKPKPITFYPEGHPMNRIKELENNLFGHLNTDLLPISKRRKLLRRFERRKERILLQNKLIVPTIDEVGKVDRPGSLWDLKEIALRKKVNTKPKLKVGLKKPTMYTIKGNKIVRLIPEREPGAFRAVNIVAPLNNAEAQLLEGTKMSLEDIKKIDRFKNYVPGVPSKVLYLKNIAPSVTQEQVSLLFNQFVLENGGPIDVRLLTGRMRGQAFVTLNRENLAIQALVEINGTIVSGQPIIAEFGRNTNRIQPEN